MLTNQNTQPDHASPDQLPPANLPWADWLDKLSSLIETCNPNNDRVCFVASLIRDAADQAYLFSIDSPTAHYRWMCDECDDGATSGPDGAPEPDRAAPVTYGTLAGHDPETYRAE
jgi:hypothetical protein